MKYITPMNLGSWTIQVEKKTNADYEVITSQKGFIAFVDQCKTRSEAIEKQGDRYALVMLKAPLAGAVGQIQEYRMDGVEVEDEEEGLMVDDVDVTDLNNLPRLVDVLFDGVLEMRRPQPTGHRC